MLSIKILQGSWLRKGSDFVLQLFKKFTKLSETTGTIQNTSDKFMPERSNKNELNSGIFIYPHRQCSFKNTQVYLRCVNGYVIANVATASLYGGNYPLVTVLGMLSIGFLPLFTLLAFLFGYFDLFNTT